MAKPPRTSYAVTSAAVPVLKTLGLEEVDPADVFELQRKEGAGAFGRVFRACYKTDRTRLAALKIIPVALEAGERGEDIENVRREIQFLRECDHPNVVAFYGAYYKDDALWVAMEYCAGGSVGDVRRARALTEPEIAVIMRGALCGLAYLHARRKIHRDVKGGNILLTASGHVKIADFGVSAQLRDTLSRRGSFVGTPYWMSPEMIQDHAYDSKADIWSLGITAIELADQKPPLFDEHPMRVLMQIPRNPPPQVARPELWSPVFLTFLRFCLRKDPAERPTAFECMQHEFIQRQKHIEGVFASGKAVATIPDETTAVEAELDAEIAEEVGTEDGLKDASARYSSDTKRDHVATPLALQSPSADALLDLSTSLSLAELPALSQREKNVDVERATSLELPSTVTPSMNRQPPTEFKLLPTSVTSPIIHKRETSTRFANMDSPSRTRNSPVSDGQPRDSVLSPGLSHPKTSISPPVSPVAPSSRPSMDVDDPLASIDTMASFRVTRLLSSFSPSPSASTLMAALHAPNGHVAADVPPRSPQQRQSFNWRSVEAALPANSVSYRSKSPREGGKISVGDPFRASHDVCVKYNSVQAQYEGAPLSSEWTALHQQFGIALVHMRCRSTASHSVDYVPALVRMLRRELLRLNGLCAPFVYRVSPVQEDVQRAKAAIDGGSFVPSHVADPHVYASLLKLWLRELPVRLFDPLTINDLTAVTRFTGSGSRDDDEDLQLVTRANVHLVEAQLHRTLQKLGTREAAVLQWLLDHLLEVNAHRSVNQMTTPALATVVAPNLYSGSSTEQLTVEQAGTMMTQVVLFVRVLLAWRRGSPLTMLDEHEVKDLAPPLAATTSVDSHAMQQRVRASITKHASNGDAEVEDAHALVSLETALCHHVNRLWCQVEQSDVTSGELKHREQELRRLFRAFQASTLELIARDSKRKDERKWARALLDLQQTGQEVKRTRLESLKRMSEWVDAALSFEAFCRLVDREHSVFEKVKRLQTRFGYSTSCGNQEFAGSAASSRSVLAHLSHWHDQQLHGKATLWAEKLSIEKCTQASLKPESVGELGERHPAIGNLLVLLGDGIQSDAPSLGWLDEHRRYRFNKTEAE